MDTASRDSEFHFFSNSVHELALPQDPLILRAHVSARIRHKYQLFQTLKLELKLPDYFGSNWDALEECLRDFSWLAGFRGVELIHAGLPFHPGHHSREVYVQILRDVVKFWSTDANFRFEVHFPEQNRAEITRLLRKH